MKLVSVWATEDEDESSFNCKYNTLKRLMIKMLSNRTKMEIQEMFTHARGARRQPPTTGGGVPNSFSGDKNQTFFHIISGHTHFEFKI